ncbi:TRAP transporter large permease [Paracoccus fistulariae]|uniref:TRAP transporter large permease protein n=1 Tax=Paracoccus fistulariae TaxID=658446 RepID=A0ABY7SHC3_9RHOB|nr:TRAP transporter large permease [Paracoccus fistulariae]MDB6180948.1 TRAP transporter large permease [Paracoccus fistulariae]WCR06244.1 TRAP transporter large permease [Paracoccus fistulariae]
MAEILIIAFFLLLVLGVPVAFSLAIAAFAAVGLSGRYPPVVVVKEMFTGLDSFPLLAVPFFILAAEIMSAGAISRMLLRFASQFVGHLRGGLGYANVLTATMFAGISGSALAAAAGPGAMMARMMERSGYSRSYAGALTVSVSVVDPIIPPSITMIIYALQDRNVSVGSLFMAGILPGVLISGAMAGVNWWISRKRDYRSDEVRPGAHEMLVNTVKALPALALIVLIIGGIRGGIFTPTEASVIAVFYAIIVSVVIYRSFTFAELWAAFLRSAIMSVAVLMILAAARAFAWVLIIEGVPQAMADAVIAMNLSPIAFLLMVNVLLLIFGMFMDPLPGVMILVPILAPIAHGLGIAPDHFAIVMIVNLTFGLMTPPVGGLIFVVATATRQKPADIIRELPPFFLAAILCLLILTFVPALSTWLPGLTRFTP